MKEERKEMSIREQIEWYIERLEEKQLKAVLLYVFKQFLHSPT